MRNGRAVRAGGTYWWLQFANGRWASRGWHWPDGPGEWDWVKRIGDCYFFPHNEAEIARQPSPHRPPIVTVRPAGWFGGGRPGEGAETVRVSIHSVHRKDDLIDFGGETVLSLFDPNRQAVRVPLRTRPRITSGEVALGSFPVREGWVPGEYEVSLRVRYEPQCGGGPESFVTKPVRFAIR
ncbi:MAG: hypothetical protein K2V38_13605 [Gemmataceae bacterium]|nr:hypothetical protein [Gemmataceae bacterium]